MSAELPTLTEIVAEVIGDALADCAQLREGIGGPHTAEIINQYAEAASDAWAEARIIHTFDALGELPIGALLRDTSGKSWEVLSQPPSVGVVNLPALLIWHPEWVRT